MPHITEEHLSDLTLLLAYLTAWQEKNPLAREDEPEYRAWKGYDFDVLNHLQDQGFISQSNTAKSLYITKEGIEKAKLLTQKFFGNESS